MTAAEDARKRYERLMASDTSSNQECSAAFNALLEAQQAEVKRKQSALSRERIKAMSLDEFEKREDEIMRWAAAGAKDGEPAPPDPQRDDDHKWTPDEIRSMSVDDFAANESAIMRELPSLGEAKAAERRAARAGAGRGGYLT